MAQRLVLNPAAPGSLLKSSPLEGGAKGGSKRRPLRSARKTDNEHLEAIRQLPCACCGFDPAGEAAHVRMTRDGKPITGMQIKPDDQYTTPLCHDCHGEQHRIGEVGFWSDVGIDPLKLAAALYRLSPNIEAMRAAVFLFKASVESE